MNSGPPSILVVIVNYKSAPLTIDCLASLVPEVAANPGARVVVTDNESGDGSVEAINAAIRDRGWAEWAEARPSGSNGGFAFGNNRAIAPSLKSPNPPRYVWLLNPDTIVKPGGLTALVEFLEAHPEVGIAGSRLEGLDGSQQVSAFRFPSVLGELDHAARFGPLRRRLARWTAGIDVGDEARAIDWTSGASMLIRREVFDAIGLLDDGYFMYYEEVDFCRRAALAGWTCWYVPASRVVHLIGQSSGVSDVTHATRRIPGYWYEARRHYFRRNHGRIGALAANLAWAGGAAFFLARNAFGRKHTIPDRYLRDFLRHTFLPIRPR